jgi:hypothetical protein
MLEFKELQLALVIFRDLIVEEAKKNLLRQKKSSSGALYKSIKGNPVKTSKNSLEFSISMENYGTFVDKGVSGKKKKYKTPYAYKDKMPPPSKLDKWTIKRGIAPRDKDGRFISRKSLQFAIARSIYNNGIKPSLFFTKPFQKYYKNLPQELLQGFGLDVQEFMSFVVKQNVKK